MKFHCEEINEAEFSSVSPSSERIKPLSTCLGIAGHVKHPVLEIIESLSKLSP